MSLNSRFPPAEKGVNPNHLSACRAQPVDGTIGSLGEFAMARLKREGLLQIICLFARITRRVRDGAIETIFQVILSPNEWNRITRRVRDGAIEIFKISTWPIARHTCSIASLIRANWSGLG
jgi:hypothetical protein